MKTLGILALIGFLLALIYAFGLFWHAAFFAGRCPSGTIEFISIVPARLACVPTESGVDLRRLSWHGYVTNGQPITRSLPMPDQGDQVDLERAAKAKRFVEFVTTVETETIDVVMSAARAGQLGDALYTAAELNLLKMEGSIEIGAAIRIHAIVLSVMAKGFPARLRM